MDEPVTSSCYNGQDLAFAVIGTIIVWTIVVWLLFRLYQKHWRNRKESQLDDPENAKQEFAFDNTAMESDIKADNEPVPKRSSDRDNKLELANNNDPLQNMRGSDYLANGFEIGARENGGIKVSKCNHAMYPINIGDTITSITVDCKNISEDDANAILRYASHHIVHFGLKSVDSDNPATFHTDRETKLLENYPTLKIDEKIDHDLVKTTKSQKLEIVNRVVDRIDSQNQNSSSKTGELSVEQQNEEIHVLNVSEIDDVSPGITKFKTSSDLNQTKYIHDTPNSTKVDPHHLSNEPENTIVTTIKTNINEINNDKHSIISNIVDNAIQISNESKIDASVPPPVNKRTKYLKRENSSDETLTDHHYLDRNNSLNTSGIARDISGIPLELPNFMTESAKWTHANRNSVTSAKPEPMIRARAPVAVQSEIISDTMIDKINTVSYTTEKIQNGEQTTDNGLTNSPNLDEIDGFSRSISTPISVESEHKVEKTELPFANGHVKNSNITFESDLVEQVLAVADGFSNETKATLSRQLSELNDDIISSDGNHVINFITSNTVLETNNNIGEKLYTTTQYDPWNKQQIEQKANKITINDTLMSDDISSTIYPSSWTDQPSSITFESSQEIKTQIHPEIGRGLVDTTIDNAVFSSDTQGVNSINITSIEIPGKLSLGNVVALNPSQPSSIIVIENDPIEHTISKLSDDTEFASKRIDSSYNQVDEPLTFVTEIALPKQTNTLEKLPPHAPARIVNASAKTSNGESSETRTFVAHRPPLERGKSHSEIPVLVRKTSIPTLPSLSTISPVLSTSTSSLSRSSPSKIPVFNSKSISPDREFTSSVIGRPNGNGVMSRSHSTLSTRSSNPGSTMISVTSIKNSSRNPSGK